MEVGKDTTSDALLLVGRVMLALIFLMSGWGKLTDFTGTVGYLGGLGAPAAPLATVVAIVLELGGAVLLVVGFQTRVAAWALVLFTIGATILAHRYWTFPEDQQRLQWIMFWKNVSMIGGLLAVAAVGGGRYSIDGWRARTA